jgi:hypothetical protein
MIADLIQQKRTDAADAAARKKSKLDAENTETLRKAKADFDNLFGEMSEEMDAIRQPGTGYTADKDGRINSVSLVVQSDELELASMEFHWSPNAKIYCTFGRDILDNRASFDFGRPDVTLADALLHANRIFPEWKAKRDEVVAASRARRIESLLDRRNWRTQDAQTANATYVQLKELDADIAENRLRQWKEEVIRECSDYLSSYTAPEYREAALGWRDRLGAADPELADDLFAKWEEDIAANVARQAEKERENALKERERAAYATAMTQWRADLKEWAKKETSRMWKPFSVTYVRYAPIGYAGSTDEDIDVIQGVYCIGALEDVVAKAMEPGAILEVYDCGAIKKKAIGAFLDAETAATYTTEPPAIDSYVRFSKEFYTGGVCVIMPPFTTDQPSGCPVRPTNPDGTDGDSGEINF